MAGETIRLCLADFFRLCKLLPVHPPHKRARFVFLSWEGAGGGRSYHFPVTFLLDLSLEEKKVIMGLVWKNWLEYIFFFKITFWMVWAAPQLLHESSQILLRLFSVLWLIKHFNIWLLNQCCIHWLFVVCFFFSFLDDYFISSTIASNSPDNKSFFYFGPRCFQIHGEQRNLCIRADLKSTLPEEARNSETSLVCTEF